MRRVWIQEDRNCLNSKLKEQEIIRKKIDKLKETIDFKCQKCSNCCYGARIYLELDDFIYLANNIQFDKKGLNISRYKVVKYSIFDFKHISAIELKQNDDGSCYYLDKNTKECLLHTYNPLTCYAYPVIIETEIYYIKFFKVSFIKRKIVRMKHCLRERKVLKKYYKTQGNALYKKHKFEQIKKGKLTFEQDEYIKE